MSGAISFGSAASGAGRSLDLMWPGIMGAWGANGAAMGVAIGGRGRPDAAAVGSSAGTAAGGGQIRSVTQWNGRAALQCYPGAVGGAFSGISPDFMGLNPAIGAAAVNGYAEDPYACYRLLAILSFAAGNSMLAETGWVFSAHNAGDVRIAGGASGFGFIQTAAGEISFTRRAGIGGAGGAVTTIPVLQGTAATLQNWHLYEMRVIGATSRANAKLRAFLDGVPLNLLGANGSSSLDWIDDNLAIPQASNGIYGLVCSFEAWGAAAAANGLMLHRAWFQAAPNEGALL